MTGPVWSDLLVFLEAWGGWITLVSGLLLAISVALVPYVVVRIPVDYFSHPRRHALRRGRRHTVIESLLMAVKNVSGAVLLLAGFILLFSPGPGLITMFFGLYLMNFPGKYRLECRLMQQPAVLRQVNAMRSRRGQPPLEVARR